MTTSLGSSDCRTEQCFIAVESLYSTGGPVPLAPGHHFRGGACSGPGSCPTPDDAWDPSSARTTPAGLPGRPCRHRRRQPPAGGQTGRRVDPGHALHHAHHRRAGRRPARDRRRHGPYTSAFPASVVPSSPVAGEGLLRLALSAPHTSWGGQVPSSTVVDVTLTDLTRSQWWPPSSSCSTTAPRLHLRRVHRTHHDRRPLPRDGDRRGLGGPNGGLSWPAGTAVPRAAVVDLPAGGGGPHQPAVPGLWPTPRSSTDDRRRPSTTCPCWSTPPPPRPPAGATPLSYTVIWSHEDAGTGFVPVPGVGDLGPDDRHRERHLLHRGARRHASGRQLPVGRGARHRLPRQPGRAQEVDEPFTGHVGRPPPGPPGRHRQQRLLRSAAPPRSGSSWPPSPGPAPARPGKR